MTVFRHSSADAVLVLLALAHGGLLLAFPLLPVIAIGLWWNSNSIGHNFVHNPFFRSRWQNQLFACYQSVLLGYPHALWRARHLAHHAERKPLLRINKELLLQCGLVLGLWGTLAILMPEFFFLIYLPAYALGMMLCALQGYYEHVRGTTSCYSPLYNLLFLNDGYHVEHHSRPGMHWSRLNREERSQHSRWPPVLRWLDIFSLESLERFVLRSPRLQRFVVRNHQRAFAKLLRGRQNIRTIAIVGGGLFPRTAIALRNLMPDASLTVIDLSRESLSAARSLMPRDVHILHDRYDPKRHRQFDLIVIPLSYQGDKEELYAGVSRGLLCVHEWIWNPRGESAIISLPLLKRLNLVQT